MKSEFKETKKYRVVCYMRVDVEVEDDTLFDSPEAALEESEHLAFIQPENVYMVEEINDVERS